MASATLDFGSFSTAEKQALLTAAKSEVLTRLTGRVQNGSSAAQSFGMTLMSQLDLTLLINALTVELGYQQPEIRVAPNFSGRSWGPCAPCAPAAQWSRLEPGITSWSDLAAFSTTGMPTGTIKIWVNAATGIEITVRLLDGTDATNTANGIQRPNDYANPGNARVWYQAAT